MVDAYHRAGVPHPAKVPDLPTVIGLEGAGTIEALGDGVTNLQVGDRVAYIFGPHGAYSQSGRYPAERYFKLADEISFKQGAAMALKGLTSWYLIRRVYKVQPGDTVLVHAASGGTGTFLRQWLNAVGAAELMDAVTHHGVHIAINQRWPLREVAKAHSALEAAQTTGSTILLPFQ